LAQAANVGEINAHLAAGEFGPAIKLAHAENDPQTRDHLLQTIATAQANAGATGASLSTTSNILDDVLRNQTYQQVGDATARGGAAQADFDSLINLITSTVAPETWDEVGGPGAVDGFAGGVYADPSGLIRRMTISDGGASLAAVRVAAKDEIKGTNIARPSELRKVSLPRLEQALQTARATGREPSEEMQAMAGIYKIQYLLVYPETGDVVIAGPAGPWSTNAEGRRVNVATGQPVLNLDDLVVLLRNANQEDGAFGCSITPRRENLARTQAYLTESSKKPLSGTERAREAWVAGLRENLGKQDIEVYGIDPRTRAARVIVEADYRMKLVGMGIEEGVLGVSSYLSMVTLDKDGSPPPMDVLRWWFTLNYDSITASEDRKAFALNGQGVKVLSENEMLTERGDRVHTGKSTGANAEFARSFTKNFPALAAKYPVYADLRNIFDLSVVATLLRSEDIPRSIGWKMVYLAPDSTVPKDSPRYDVRLGPAAKEVETVANYRVIGRKHVIAGVSGGVTVRAKELVQPSFIKRDDTQTVGVKREGSVPTATSRTAWWWD